MFTIRNFESRTLSWWYDQRDNIDFQPSYQRKGRLWSEKDKSYLIDSILNGFDMPKIYIADFTFFNSGLNEKRKPYSVVDGKQRFEAMFDFFKDELTLDKDFIYLEDTKLNLSGLSYKDLKAKYPKIASIFENFNLSVISVITDSDAMINEMFIRLNKSKPLTGAELRNAMKGVIPNLTRQIIQQPFFIDRVRFNTNRGQDSNVATKLLLIEFRGKFVDTKKTHLDKLVDDAIAAETSNFDTIIINITRVLGYMNDSFINKDYLLASSGLVPVYYWFYRTNGGIRNDMRNFLVQFEKKRKDSRKIATKSLEDESEIIDTKNLDYINFDRLSKSLNDQASLQGCYNILENKWLIWLSLESLDE
jgi:hypothetical protein